MQRGEMLEQMVELEHHPDAPVEVAPCATAQCLPRPIDMSSIIDPTRGDGIEPGDRAKDARLA